MSVRAVLLYWILAGAQAAPALWLGTNEVRPGRVIEFRAPLNAYARAEANRSGLSVPFITGAVVVPTNMMDLRRPTPILLVSVPSGGRSIPAMRGYTNAALSEGWIVLAFDGPKVPLEADTVQWGWAVVGSGLEQLHKLWPASKAWPLACAGFSGGAKRSAALGAALTRQNYRVIGVFMAGCNEDRATLGLALFAPCTGYLSVPMYLSNGTEDRIAGPDYAVKVNLSLHHSGFSQVKSEVYRGDHRLEKEHVRKALQWFRALDPGRR